MIQIIFSSGVVEAFSEALQGNKDSITELVPILIRVHIENTLNLILST